MQKHEATPRSPHAPNTLLRKAREAQGCSQRELALFLQVGVSTVRSWESGRHIPGRELQARLCQHFALSPAQLGLPPLPPFLSTEGEEELLVQKCEQHSISVAREQECRAIDSPAPAHPPRRFSFAVVDRNRRKILHRVRSIWIHGVLARSLHDIPLIPLDLMEVPEAVTNPWYVSVRETLGPTRTLPTGTTLAQLYDFSEGTLLVLGEPGAGKTTLLLELASVLLQRAEQNERYPIPVVFTLASWPRKKTSLVDWLVEELEKKYAVPRKVGHVWIETDQLSFLLDGLDETSEEARPGCIKAISAYQAKHPDVSLVISCRQLEYFALPDRLAFQQAVVIQPLTREQIALYFEQAGSTFEAIRWTLREDEDLQEMCTTPLLLRILVLTYQEAPMTTFTQASTLEERRRSIFTTYVKRMLTRRSAENRYSLQQTVQWLTHMASYLRAQHQTEFSLERIEPGWLADDRVRKQFCATKTRIIDGARSCIIAALVALFSGEARHHASGISGGLSSWLGNGSSKTILGWMASGIGGGLGGGSSLRIMIALVIALVLCFIDGPLPALSLRAVWQGAIKGLHTGLALGLLVGLVAGFWFARAGGMASGVTHGVNDGVFYGLLAGLEAGLLTIFRQRSDLGQENSVALRSLFEPARWLKRSLDRCFDVFSTSGCAGMSYGAVSIALTGKITLNLLFVSSIIALLFGLMSSRRDEPELRHAWDEEIKYIESISWSWEAARQNWQPIIGKRLAVGLMVAVCVMGILTGASCLFHGLAYSFRSGLVYGLTSGLVGSVASVLASILHDGWSSSIPNEYELPSPNEGIRRLFRQAIFAASLFGPSGGLLSGLVCALAFGLIAQIPGWPILAAGVTLVFGVIFALQSFLISGGITWLEHYLLRWYLWRSGAFPARMVPFLDYAAERILLHKSDGGYLFFHQLLLDYFASLHTGCLPGNSATMSAKSKEHSSTD